MEKLNLKASKREKIGKKANSLRKQGLIPAVVYGHGMSSIPISVYEKDFASIVASSSGSNAIINLKLDDMDFPVLMHDMQKKSTTDKVLHIDFFKVNMNEAIKTKIHIEFQGVPIGVKNDGGILVHKLREIEVKCLPDKIPEKFIVDVSNLKIGETISVSDLKTFEDVEFITALTEPVTYVSAPAKEEEVVAAPVEAAAQVAPQAAETAQTAAPAAKSPDKDAAAKDAKK